jgi:hypothetical protein
MKLIKRVSTHKTLTLEDEWGRELGEGTDTTYTLKYLDKEMTFTAEDMELLAALIVDARAE